MAAYSGPCTGKSSFEPPQRINTSILSLNSAKASIEKTAVLGLRVCTVLGSRRLNTPTNVISSFLLMAVSTPRPRLPYPRSEEHTSELQSRPHLVCRLL